MGGSVRGELGDERLDEAFDLVVIGAGINGVGIACDAAARGLSVALLEQRDICSGVSAWSGRLVHGGLKYLEQYDVPLVRESLRERERLFRLAPHLVTPRWLLMPFYRHNRRPSWLIRLGMLTYDALSLDKKWSFHHRVLRTPALLTRFAGINRDGLGGAAAFVDGQVELAERLCVELTVAAVADGAVVRTRARVDEPVVEDGTVVGVRFVDTEDGSRHEVRGRVVLNVAGPWIDQVFTRESLATAPDQPRLNGGTKGSHLVVDRFPGAPSDVVYYESRVDGRLVLVIPWRGRYMLGTTDIRVEGDPDDARCDADELEYILGEVNSLVPRANLTPDDVLYTMSGVRPLPYKPEGEPGSIPRSHVLHDHGEGLHNLVTVVGGKLTTYRQLAEDAVDDAIRRLGRPRVRSATRTRPFPGARTTDLERYRRDFVTASGLPVAVARRLVDVYGTRAPEVLRTIRSAHGLDEVLDTSTGLTAGELVFAVDHELARSLADVLARRTMTAFDPGHGLGFVDRAADVLGDHLGWSAQERQHQVSDYRDWLGHLAVPARATRAVAS